VNFTVRECKKEDLPEALDLIRELATYEKAHEVVDLSLEQFQIDGFGEQPLFSMYVAVQSSKVMGIALFYYRYSTWKGKTLFLEDIVVKRNQRGKGIGKALFDKVIERTKKENCHRMSWQVLHWNEPAINFYKKYGAKIDGEWLNCNFFEDDLERL